ncbi:MAG: hypothetical protein Q7T57_04895 [Dehalococcoidales bacterium]|nr:hypothetical protein [Dehalococcoidales bacterium]
MLQLRMLADRLHLHAAALLDSLKLFSFLIIFVPFVAERLVLSRALASAVCFLLSRRLLEILFLETMQAPARHMHCMEAVRDIS